MNKNYFILGIIILMSIGFASALAPVNLSVAENFSIVAETTITDATPTTSMIIGDIAVDPNAGSFITGMSCTRVNGTIYDNNAGYTGGFDSNVSCLITDAVETLAVQQAMLSAYNDARDRINPNFTEWNSGHLGGLILNAGLYKWSSTVDVATDLILDCQGDVNAVFIFQGSSTFGLTAGKSINLTNGCQAGNIFWQFDTTVNLGASSVFEGTILAGTTITVMNGAIINGRAFGDSVILDSNQITLPVLSAPCVPDWSCSEYQCQMDDLEQCIMVADNNMCDLPYSGDYTEFPHQACDFCTPEWGCSGYGACYLGDLQSCNAEQDLNFCGEPYLGDYSELLPQTESCDFCTPIYQCSGYGDCQLGDVRLCNGTNDLNTCVEHSYSGNLSEFTQSCTFCTENWTQIPPTSCNGIIDDYTIHYGDVNNCGTTDNLPSDNGTVIDCCIESWVSVSHDCITYQKLISYTDNNACGTSYRLPVNNGTSFACGSTSGGGSTLVSQSALPITGGVTTTVISEPNVLVRIWHNFVDWIKMLFGG